jgi:MFS family permease
MVVMALTRGPDAAVAPKLPTVIAAASVGTLLAWYDFYLYGVLAVFFADRFFPAGHSALGLLASLAVFWFGFVLRPCGAVLFGHLGDKIGRKPIFVAALLLMGVATFAIGLLPGYATIGVLAPLLLVLMRALQGLAIGGEYGGAAIYVAEHAPDGRRGLHTSWLQVTATMGIVLTLLVVLACRAAFGDDGFADWGWRVPFWVSAILVPLALYIHLQFDEPPLYARLREQGKTAPNPAKESFASLGNWRFMTLALFGAAAPEGVVWFTGQFYALYYLATVLKVPNATLSVLMIVVLTLASPLFVVFGALSDKIGRRNIMTAGFALAAISYWPVFGWMAQFKNDPLILGGLVFYLVILAAMAYGPIAAFLVELFPARIRYSSVSLPYHVGNGMIGGLVPVVGIAFATALGDPRYALVYPIVIAAVGVVVSLVWLKPRTDEVRIWREVGGGPPPVPDQP